MVDFSILYLPSRYHDELVVRRFDICYCFISMLNTHVTFSHVKSVSRFSPSLLRLSEEILILAFYIPQKAEFSPTSPSQSLAEEFHSQTTPIRLLAHAPLLFPFPFPPPYSPV